MWQQRTVKVYDWETETLLPLLFFSKKRNTFSRVSYNTCWVIGTVNQYAIVTSKQTAAALLAPSKWLWFSSHTASATNPTWGMLSPLKSLSQNIPVWHILEMPQLHLRHPQDPSEVPRHWDAMYSSPGSWHWSQCIQCIQAPSGLPSLLSPNLILFTIKQSFFLSATSWFTADNLVFDCCGFFCLFCWFFLVESLDMFEQTMPANCC